MADFVNEASVDAGKTLGELAKDIVTGDHITIDASVNIGDLLKEHGLRLVHFRPKSNEGLYGLTVVYKAFGRNCSTLKVATSVTHKLDDFTKKVGARLAIENFVNGNAIVIPVSNYYRGRNFAFLSDMFDY